MTRRDEQHRPQYKHFVSQAHRIKIVRILFYFILISPHSGLMLRKQIAHYLKEGLKYIILISYWQPIF